MSKKLHIIFLLLLMITQTATPYSLANFKSSFFMASISSLGKGFQRLYNPKTTLGKFSIFITFLGVATIGIFSYFRKNNKKIITKTIIPEIELTTYGEEVIPGTVELTEFQPESTRREPVSPRMNSETITGKEIEEGVDYESKLKTYNEEVLPGSIELTESPVEIITEPVSSYVDSETVTGKEIEEKVNYESKLDTFFYKQRNDEKSSKLIKNHFNEITYLQELKNQKDMLEKAVKRKMYKSFRAIVKNLKHDLFLKMELKIEGKNILLKTIMDNFRKGKQKNLIKSLGENNFTKATKIVDKKLLQDKEFILKIMALMVTPLKTGNDKIKPFLEKIFKLGVDPNSKLNITKNGEEYETVLLHVALEESAGFTTFLIKQMNTQAVKKIKAGELKDGNGKSTLEYVNRAKEHIKKAFRSAVDK